MAPSNGESEVQRVVVCVSARSFNGDLIHLAGYNQPSLSEECMCVLLSFPFLSWWQQKRGCVSWKLRCCLNQLTRSWFSLGMCLKTRSSLRMVALWKTSFSISCVSNSRWKASQTSPGPFTRCAAFCGACGVKLVVCLGLILHCSKYHRQHPLPLARWICSLALAARALRLRIATRCGESSKRNALEHWWHWTPCLLCPCWTWFKRRNCRVLMIGSRGKSSWVKRPLRLWRGASPWMSKTDLLKLLPLVSAFVMKNGTGRSRRPCTACTSCCRCAPIVTPWAPCGPGLAWPQVPPSSLCLQIMAVSPLMVDFGVWLLARESYVLAVHVDSTYMPMFPHVSP